MWNHLKQWCNGLLATRSSQSSASKTEVLILGQKWLGPGEILRIVEVDLDGSTHRLALWNTKSSAQMIELDSDRLSQAAKGVSC